MRPHRDQRRRARRDQRGPARGAQCGQAGSSTSSRRSSVWWTRRSSASTPSGHQRRRRARGSRSCRFRARSRRASRAKALPQPSAPTMTRPSRAASGCRSFTRPSDVRCSINSAGCRRRYQVRSSSPRTYLPCSHRRSLPSPRPPPFPQLRQRRHCPHQHHSFLRLSPSARATFHAVPRRPERPGTTTERLSRSAYRRSGARN